MNNCLTKKYLQSIVGKKVRIITINGYQQTGKLIDFDDCSLVVEEKGQQFLMLLNGISTVSS